MDTELNPILNELVIDIENDNFLILIPPNNE